MDSETADLPESLQRVRIKISPAPVWARSLAGAADTIVAGLLSFAVVVIILIPVYFPETEALIQQYADEIGGNILTDTELAGSFLEDQNLRNMILASQVTIYSVFFLYFLLNEWVLRGSSFGKMIFRITTVRRQSDQPLSLGIIFLRSWLKTVFLLFFSPLLWLTFLYAFLQKEKRTVHDLLTGTWVID